jgi:hypothetical protein
LLLRSAHISIADPTFERSKSRPAHQNRAIACAPVVLIQKFEPIFTENRRLRRNFRTNTQRLRDKTTILSYVL